MNDETNSGFQGVWIPKNICAARTLNWAEKALIAEINDLDRDSKKGCYAGNAHFARILGSAVSTAANMVSRLKKKRVIVELWSDGKNRGLRVDFDRLEELEKEKTGSLNREASSLNREASGEKNDDAYRSGDDVSLNREASGEDAYSNKEASDVKQSSDAYRFSEHRNSKGFSTTKVLKELNRTTHSTTTGTGDKPPETQTSAAAVCVDCDNSSKTEKPQKIPKKKKRRKKPDRAKSQFSLEDCLRYAELCKKRGENVLNPKGLATKIFRSGEADAFIKAELYPERLSEDYPPPVEFTDEPCEFCFGAKMEIVEGLGARSCLGCLDEREKPTGKKPKGDP